MLTDETLGQTLQNKKWPQIVRTQSAKTKKEEKGPAGVRILIQREAP